MLEFSFEGEVIEWRGPAPHYFVRLPDSAADTIRELAGALTYGWGCIPVSVIVGRTRYTTSLFPKNGGYLLGVKSAVRSAEGIGLGDVISLTMFTGSVRGD